MFSRIWFNSDDDLPQEPGLRTILSLNTYDEDKNFFLTNSHT